MGKASAETTEKERNNAEKNAGTLACYTKFRNIFNIVLFIYLINYVTAIFTTVKTNLNWQINVAAGKYMSIIKKER